jgi:hypothetical protein
MLAAQSYTCLNSRKFPGHRCASNRASASGSSVRPFSSRASITVGHCT